MRIYPVTSKAFESTRIVIIEREKERFTTYIRNEKIVKSLKHRKGWGEPFVDKITWS